MQFMIMNYVPQAGYAETGKPEADPDGPAWGAYTQALIEAGVMRSGNALKPALTATTVRVRDGRREVHDRPYAEAKENLGGYYIIEVDDLDGALPGRPRTRRLLQARSKCGRSSLCERR